MEPKSRSFYTSAWIRARTQQSPSNGLRPWQLLQQHGGLLTLRSEIYLFWQPNIIWDVAQVSLIWYLGSPVSKNKRLACWHRVNNEINAHLLRKITWYRELDHLTPAISDWVTWVHSGHRSKVSMIEGWTDYRILPHFRNNYCLLVLSNRSLHLWANRPDTIILL